MLRVVILLVVLPHGIRPDPKPFANRRFVVVDTVLNLVRLARVVEDQALVVFRAGVHHLTKHVERREDTEEGLVQALAVLNHILTEDKHIIDVGAQIRRQVHTVLHRQQKEDFPVTPVHETLSYTRVFHERLVVHTIIQKQKCTRFPAAGYNATLALENLFDCIALVITVNEQVRDELLVVVIAVLRPGHDDADGQVSLVVHYVRHERRLARAALADEYAHLVIANLARIKLFEL